MIRCDVMHNIFQGGGQHLVASIIMELIAQCRFAPGSPLPVQLKIAWLEAKAWFSHHHIRCILPLFTRGRFSLRESAYPCLTGKAYTCRCLIAWLASVTQQWSKTYQNGQNPLTHQMAIACFALADFCYILDVAPRRKLVQEPYRSRLVKHGRMYLNSYMWLASDALRRRICLYAVKPKLHQFCHLLDDILNDAMSPGDYWNFSDEDMMGILKKVAQKSSRRTLWRAVRWT